MKRLLRTDRNANKIKKEEPISPFDSLKDNGFSFGEINFLSVNLSQ